jgi:hypothetical protein
MTFASVVTAPPRASMLPLTIVRAPSVIDVKASRFPWNTVSAPKVAELPTCQNTLQA